VIPVAEGKISKRDNYFVMQKSGLSVTIPANSSKWYYFDAFDDAIAVSGYYIADRRLTVVCCVYQAGLNKSQFAFNNPTSAEITSDVSVEYLRRQ
jgi:hypothetical protein